MRFSLLFLLGIFLSISAIAQNTISQPVLLINHTIHLQDEVSFSGSINGRHYAIVQLPGNISQLQGIRGVKMLDYLPKNAGIFSIEGSALEEFRTVLRNLNGQAVPVKPEWKKSNRLFENNLPDWAWITNEKIKVWLGYYQDIDPSTALDWVQKAGYEVVDERRKEALVAVAVEPSAIDHLITLPFVYYVQEEEDPGQPENYTARTDHRINSIQSAIPGATQYDGSGVVVGHGDDGEIGPHIDFSGRLSQSAPPSSGDHGDHVAGTIFGAGNLDPKGRGMAPGAEIFYQDYPDNLNDVDQNYDNLNVRVTNSSYSNGCNAGYTGFTRQMDMDVIHNPNLLHIFSAGNNGSSDCGYGAGSGWGNVTGGHKIAKNVIATANVNHQDNLVSSSSRGPASDGRIKPDISAVGASVYSTTDPNLYTQKTGTSMSAPGVAGTAAVLYQAYRDKNGNQDPPSGLLKAILLNGADDIGNPGPDYRYGYGRINARRSYRMIESTNHLTSNVSDGSNKSFQISVPANTASVKVMLYWADPAASLLASRALVNDLDLKVNIDGNLYQPWVLDPTPNSSNLNSHAIPARDSLNNIEQITITNPPAGNLDINVEGYNIPFGNQTFYLVYYFEENDPVLTYPVGGEGLVPGTTETIRWDAPDANGSFIIEYSDDNGTTWNNISSSVPATRRYHNWTVPSGAGNEYLVRVSRNGKSSQSTHPFTVINRPANIKISKICPDSLHLIWDVVNGATDYIIYKLGQKYMDSIGSSTQPYYKAAVNNLQQEEWFSVAAVVNGGVGMRANAIQRKQTSLLNCTVEDDLKISRILSPTTGALPDCYNTSGVPVVVELINNGLDSIFNFSISYRLNMGSVTENITDTIPPGGLYTYTFSSTINLGTANSTRFKVWSNLSGDLNPYNDSISDYVHTYPGSTTTFPFVEDFGSFSSCGTSSNCGLTVCKLRNGWKNAENGLDDDIDFRVDAGGTPSVGTGPSIDHLPGSSNGQYLYLEASGGCDSSEAMLMSPCIDLSSASAPILEFWYHMNGVNMGTLSLDIYDGSEWHNNVIPVIRGQQGSQWQNAVVELHPFTGQSVVLRFRGKTGNGFASDIALDHISMFENNSAPIADFDLDNSVSCLDGVVNFTDDSRNIPTTWSWDIQPAGYSYVNGSDSASQNISVQFQNTGVYDVTLVAYNAFGSDTVVHTQAVTVDAGQQLPIYEDFENSAFPPAGWAINNPDSQSQWQEKTVTGAAGTKTKAVAFDNLNSGSRGQEDGLITLNLDLRTITDPLLFFDLAYAQRSGNTGDSLVIDYSTDCGGTFTSTTYAKGGSELNTAQSPSGLFIPSSASDWRRDTLDLTPYTGNNVKLRFRNVSGEGNLIYLDNIQLVSAGTVAPVSFFGSSIDSFACTNDNITFHDSISGGTPDSIYWDFGMNAIPNKASTAGPHQIKFIRTGTQTITLTVMNAGGFSTHSMQLEIGERPVAAFGTSVPTPQTIQFSDMSLYDPEEWLWHFGDGDSSTLQNPLHTYATAGTYNVYLKVTNACGTTDRTQTLVVSGLGLDDNLGLQNLVLFPNPSSGVFNLQYQSSVGQDVKVQVLDLSGKVLVQKNTGIRSGINELQLDLSSYRDGLYMIRVETDYGVKILKAVMR